MKPATTSPDADRSDDRCADRRVDLDVTGMTCAACASRIERRLNKFDGVVASVNYATERAHVRLSDTPIAVTELIAAIEATGYGAHEHAPDGPDPDRTADLRRRLVVAVGLGLPVLLLSMVPALQFDGWQWVALALTTPVATWAAWPFHRAMARNLRHGQTTMDTLISIGVAAAYGWSLWALVATPAGDIGMSMTMEMDAGGASVVPHIYLEVASTVVAFILAGRYFEARAKRRSGDALRSLLDLGAKDVAVLGDDGSEQLRPIDQLAVGDRFVVRPGERIATDGVVVDGTSAVDRSLVTGESVPVEVAPGDAVIGATVNAHGRLVVEATRVGADTQLAQMARLVEAAQSGKAPVQRLADRVSAVFVPIVLGLAVITLALWLAVTGDTERAFAASVAVLIIACPCALGLATPTALLVGTGRGAQLGILIRGPEILERTREVDTIVLDKTGTVTTGRMELVAVRPFGVADRDHVARLASALEGLEPILLTGDNATTAQAVAAAVGIGEVRAEVMPADKVGVVTDLQRAGRTVAMVGDGVNDAAALAQADLGISMGSGTDVAIEASDLTLVREDLVAAVDAIRLSRRTLATIKGNLFWAFAYNVLAIPLAMLGVLSPTIAGAAMALSSVFVVSNSLRLRRFRRSGARD
jgi:Cu+-exporting ATPase